MRSVIIFFFEDTAIQGAGRFMYPYPMVNTVGGILHSDFKPVPATPTAVGAEIT